MFTGTNPSQIWKKASKDLPVSLFQAHHSWLASSPILMGLERKLKGIHHRARYQFTSGDTTGCSGGRSGGGGRSESVLEFRIIQIETDRE